MNPGTLDRRIKILARDATQDTLGDDAVDWPVLLTVWASWRETSCAERLRNPQLAAELNVVATIRHTSTTLTTAMRVEDWLGRRWSIIGISALPGRQQGYEISLTALDKLGATAA